MEVSCVGIGGESAMAECGFAMPSYSLTRGCWGAGGRQFRLLLVGRCRGFIMRLYLAISPVDRNLVGGHNEHVGGEDGDKSILS